MTQQVLQFSILSSSQECISILKALDGKIFDDNKILQINIQQEDDESYQFQLVSGKTLYHRGKIQTQNYQDTITTSIAVYEGIYIKLKHVINTFILVIGITAITYLQFESFQTTILAIIICLLPIIHVLTRRQQQNNQLLQLLIQQFQIEEIITA